MLSGELPRVANFFGRLPCTRYALTCHKIVNRTNKDNEKDEENVKKLIDNIRITLNLKTINDWNSITQKQIKEIGGNSLLKKHTIYEIKCIGFPEGKNKFKPHKFWKSKENTISFINNLKEKLKLNSMKDWDLLTTNQIKLHGGRELLKKHSLYEIKCLGFPEGINKFEKPIKTNKYWENEENIQNFLSKLKENLNLKTFEDWNKITRNQIELNGGYKLLNRYSLFEIKSLGFPDGFDLFYYENKSFDFWNNKENVKKYLEFLLHKLNIKTHKELTKNKIYLHGGKELFKIYSLYELRCLAFPNEKEFIFPKQSISYWKNDENIQNYFVFLRELFTDRKRFTINDIRKFGGSSLLKIYTFNEIKRKIFPDMNDEKIITNNVSNVNCNNIKPTRTNFWDNMENVNEFLSKLKEKLNLHSAEDWNLLTQNQIIENGGSSLLKTYSMFEIKCLGFPNGKKYFEQNVKQKPSGYWDIQENIKDFLSKLQEKLNLTSAEDWNLLTQKQIVENGGSSLLKTYSMFEIKCFGFPDGKSLFSQPKKSQKYWENQENIQSFLLMMKEKFNLNSAEDWNSITFNQIKACGGCRLLKKYSVYEIKCLAFPGGIDIYVKPNKPFGFWNNDLNFQNFINRLKEKYNIKTIDDWKRISKNQIITEGGWGIFSKFTDKQLEEKIPEIFSKKIRPSQRWLCLLVQKLFPDEEIVEDYFHSDISRKTGFPVQFDIFLVRRNIAFEYHGQQHYEDIPSGFAPLQMYKYRDQEKAIICKKFGILLIVIPYWWDNTIESLESTISYQYPELFKKD